MISLPWIKHFKSYTDGGYVGELESLDRMELVIGEFEEHFGIPFTKAKTEGTLTSRGKFSENKFPIFNINYN